MDIYAPIAQRLGISKIKTELDDLSLKYWKPEVYYNLVKGSEPKENRTRRICAADRGRSVRRHMKNAHIRGESIRTCKAFFQYL